MSKQHNAQPTDENDVRRIPLWTRRYAQNRALPVAVAVVVNALLFLGLAGLSLAAGKAHRAENTGLLTVIVAALVVVMVGVIWTAIPRWGGRWIQRIGQRAYGSEGTVSVAAAVRPPTRWLLILLAAGMFVGVATSVLLGITGILPDTYAMPFSALFVVPFLVVLNLLLRPVTGPIYFLWPILYAAHAVLILAGVPLNFTGAASILNIALPIVGYCLVMVIAAHTYSRYALARLKKLTHVDVTGAESGSDDD
jgi:hypothetical protein